MDVIWAVFGLCFFLFGAAAGSFLNVCILRIPEGRNIVSEPSRCPSCGKRLKWYELIPILSWLCLRGRCAGCKAPISVQYPIVEAANAVLWTLVYFRFGLTYYSALCCLMASALFALSVIDSRTREIPFGINVFIFILGAAALILDRGRFVSHIIGFFAVSVPLLLILYISGGRAIGGGDVKLMAAAGLFLGGKLIVFAFFAGCVIGSVIHLVRMRFFGADRSLAFGPYLAAGVFVSMLWGDGIVAWYLALLGR